MPPADQTVLLVAARPGFTYVEPRSKPPNRELARASSYTFRVPLGPAMSLVSAKLCSPAYLDDAVALRRKKVVCDPWYEGYSGSVGSTGENRQTKGEKASEEAAASASKDLKGLVAAALEVGLKKDLVEALDAIGVDASTLTNNGQRSDALRFWLDSQG